MEEVLTLGVGDWTGVGSGAGGGGVYRDGVGGGGGSASGSGGRARLGDATDDVTQVSAMTFLRYTGDRLIGFQDSKLFTRILFRPRTTFIKMEEGKPLLPRHDLITHIILVS